MGSKNPVFPFSACFDLRPCYTPRSSPLPIGFIPTKRWTWSRVKRSPPTTSQGKKSIQFDSKNHSKHSFTNTTLCGSLEEEVSNSPPKKNRGSLPWRVFVRQTKGSTTSPMPSALCLSLGSQALVKLNRKAVHIVFEKKTLTLPKFNMAPELDLRVWLRVKDGKSMTLWKFNSLPLKSYQNPKGSRLRTIHFQGQTRC